MSGWHRARTRAALAAVIAVAIVLAALLAVALTGDDESAPSRPVAGPVSPDMERLTGATVPVATTVDGRRTNVASGWVIDARRTLVVTNAHLLYLQRRTGALRVSVAVAGRRRDARVLAAAPCEDLAVLDVEGSAPAQLEVAGADDLERGADVVAAGFPFSREPARNMVPTQTRVAVADGPAPGPRGPEVVPLPNVLQLETSLRPGYSGGPVVDGRTRVVGVIAIGGAGRSQERTFAVTAERARSVLEDLMRQMSRGWIGAALDPGREGLALTSTVPGGPAARAGLAGGPWIVDEWDGRAVGDDMSGYCRAARLGQAGERARLTVREAVAGRGGYRAAPGARQRVVEVAYE